MLVFLSISAAAKSSTASVCIERHVVAETFCSSNNTDNQSQESPSPCARTEYDITIFARVRSCLVGRGKHLHLWDVVGHHITIRRPIFSS